MHRKLALKNATRSMKDYGVYFFTLVLGVCVFYMFNSIYSQQAMLGLSERMTSSAEAMQKILGYVSVFVAIVLGFLIVYANLFFIKRRKKEMGIYLTLGMEKRDVSIILLLETVVVAVCALFVGIILGVFLSQFMSVFTGKMFDADLTQLSFVFSYSALQKCMICFMIIFGVVIIFNVSAIERYKLIDLIYEERKNEELKIRNIRCIYFIFVGAVLLLGIAYYLIIKNGMMKIGLMFALSVLCGGVGTLLFFYALSGILMDLLRRKKRIYYRNLNMFVVRQLGNRINTNYVSISVVSIVLLFAIGIFATGYGMQDVMTKELVGYAGSDFSFISFYEEEGALDDPYEKMKEFIEKNAEVESWCDFTIYATQLTYGDIGIPLASDVAMWNTDKINFMTLEDFNKVMKLQGKDELQLQSLEYAIITNLNSMNEFADEMMKTEVPIVIDEVKLMPKCAMIGSVENGSNYATIIVADEWMQMLSPREAILNVNCKGKESALKFEEAIEIEMSRDMSDNHYYYVSRAKLMADAMGNKALFSYLSIYLGMVFMITCVAILAIQQLTEAADNKSRFCMLKKLGTETSMIHKALFLQVLCYFLAPLLLAIVHSYFGLKAVVATLDMYGKINIAESGAITAIFVVVLYVFYFGLTYIGCKNVLKGR